MPCKGSYRRWVANTLLGQFGSAGGVLAWTQVFGSEKGLSEALLAAEHADRGAGTAVFQRNRFLIDCATPPSSSGQGRRPLRSETEIRILVGAPSAVASAHRAINSAGECFLYTEEVGGSNPSSPTTKPQVRGTIGTCHQSRRTPAKWPNVATRIRSHVVGVLSSPQAPKLRE